jgi:hypothetical protein
MSLDPSVNPARPGPILDVGRPDPRPLPITASASTTVRNKNFLIIVLFTGFLGWFAYDGFIKYPQEDDRLVEVMKTMVESHRQLDASDLPILNAWKGWSRSSPAEREVMTAMAIKAKVEGWHTETDMNTQKYIVAGLALGVLAAIWWFFHCQRRRAIAEEATVSPAPGVVIPWENITRIDNTRWKSSGIVEITYKDAAGASRTATFDDYVLDRDPLLDILDQLAARAVHAELIPKDELPAEVAGAPGEEPAA